MREIFLSVLFAGLLAPVSVFAQEGDLRTEIRAALLNAGGSENLSEDEFERLADALAAEAAGQEVSPSDIALSQVEARFVENPAPLRATVPVEEGFDWRPLAGTAAFLLLLGGALWYWRRMHHGGALGHVS